MAYCTKCGHEIPAGASFCPACGKSTDRNYVEVSRKSRLVAALLCLFFGVFGIHRFYCGKIGTGILIILTVGGFGGIWPLIDLILIICGVFRDAEGKRLLEWDVQ